MNNISVTTVTHQTGEHTIMSVVLKQTLQGAAQSRRKRITTGKSDKMKPITQTQRMGTVLTRSEFNRMQVNAEQPPTDRCAAQREVTTPLHLRLNKQCAMWIPLIFSHYIIRVPPTCV